MSIVLRSDDMRRQNRRRILEVVRRKGVVSRGEIAQAASLSPATVSTITNNLIAEGVLVAREAPAAPSAGRGRPSVDLTVNPDFCHAVTLVLKVGSITCAVIDYAGTLIALEEVQIELSTMDWRAFRDILIKVIRETLEQAGLAGEPIAGISAGVQGTTDSTRTRMLWSPITALTDIPLGDWLEAEFGAPTHVSNDCDLIARALNWRNPEHYDDNFAALLLAHGVGMGLFLRGTIINGTGSSGTEFGHMMHRPGGALCRCGSRGCIEAYAGDYAIARRFRGDPEDMVPPGHANPDDIDRIAEAARAGDENALRAFAEAGTAIGAGLAAIFALVDPFSVALVGHGATAFDLMEPALRDTLSGATRRAAVEISIDLFHDEVPLLLEGCAIDALSRIDALQAVGEAIRA